MFSYHTAFLFIHEKMTHRERKKKKPQTYDSKKETKHIYDMFNKNEWKRTKGKQLLTN
jgi:hypothetical protein